MDVFAKCSQVPIGKELEASGFGAHRRVLQSGPGAEVVVDGRAMLMLGSGDYLGLAGDARVKRAAAGALELWGTSSAGCALEATFDLQPELERSLARFLGRDGAVVYGSGYLAGLGVISTLAGPGDVLVIERRAHASILDGSALSGAEVKRFRHDEPGDLERVMDGCGEAGTLVVVEGVHGLEGDVAPLPRIVRACRDRGARLVLDDTHGMGVLGRGGRGTAEHFDLEDEVDVVMGSTGAALAGPGGFAAAGRTVIDFLRDTRSNRPLLFASSPSPAALAAVQAALGIAEAEPGLRSRLWTITERVHRALRGMGLDAGPSRTPIVALPAEPLERACELWRALTAEGLFVHAVLPPAVPSSRCRIRITLTASLADGQVDRLLAILEERSTRSGGAGGAPGVAAARKAG